jgi:hypothetical protein
VPTENSAESSRSSRRDVLHRVVLIDANNERWIVIEPETRDFSIF